MALFNTVDVVLTPTYSVAILLLSVTIESTTVTSGFPSSPAVTLIVYER